MWGKAPSVGSRGWVGHGLLDPPAPSAYTRNHMVAYAQDAELDRIFGALSDAKRRAILRTLAEGEATVGELARPFDVSRQAISKHLVVLEDAGLVERTPDGRMTRCALDPEPMRDVAEWLERFRTYWEDRLESLSRYIERESSIEEQEPPDREEEER